jgi:uncharacterized LabA/DUF88 family protein/uncharacterized protein YdcH (DUF465 family)
MNIELSNKRLSALTFLASGLFGLGICSQQPAIAFPSGAGLAVTCFTTKSRRQESTTIDRDKIQKLEQNLSLVIEQENRRNLHVDRLITTVNNLQASEASLLEQLQAQIDRQERDNLQINALTARLEELDLTIDRLTNKVGVQHSLTTRAIQKLQQDKHKLKGEIAALRAENLNPINLAPQQLTEVAATAAPVETTTHLLIDGNAMHFIAKKIGNISYLNLRQALTKDAKNVICKIYLSDTKKTGQQGFIDKLKEIGFDVILFPLTTLSTGVQKTKGDDVQLAIDATSVRSGDRVILCAQDGDFSPVIDRLKQMNVDFTVVAHKPFLSSHLKKAAGENIVYLTDLPDIKLA